MTTPEADILNSSVQTASRPCCEEPLRMPVALLLLAKPGIVIAEMLAGVAGALLAAPAPGPTVLCLLLLLLALGAGGAAMANCLMEEKTDRTMPRLSRRCLALESAGRRTVTLLATGLGMGAILLAAFMFTPLALILLLVASFVYIVVYTGWLKRRTPWSVLAGGIPGALPPLIGAAAVSDHLQAAPVLLAAMIYLWQLPHFLFLALHCRDQYRLAGIPVLPLTHGVGTARRFTLLAAMALVPVTNAFCIAAGHGRGLTLILVVLALSFSLLSYDSLYRKKEYRRGFIGSLAYMVGLLVAVIIGAIHGTSG